MTDWTPETNRIQTMHLTADELAALKAAKWGWVASHEFRPDDWRDVEAPNWSDVRIYRAKPAPVTQDVVPWEVIVSNLVEAMETARDYVSDAACGYVWTQGQSGSPLVKIDTKIPKDDMASIDKALKAARDSLQQRPQPAATGAVTELLVKAGLGLKRIVEEIDGAMKNGTWRDEHGMRLKDTPEWVEFYNAITEAAAVAHAKRMTGCV